MTTGVAIRAVAGAVAGVFAALLMAGCGSSAEPTTTDLFREYLDATNVKGDPFQGATAGDRRANMASMGSVSQVQYRLFAADQCGDDLMGSMEGCDLSVAVTKAAQGFAGLDGTVHQRNVLVKRGDTGRLEWMTLYVARKSDGSSALVDDDGGLYLEGLDDFRRNNDLLDADDWILAPRDITATPGEGELVAVSGHTGPRWELWVIGGAALLVVAVGGRLLIRRRRAGSD
ncbi:hypothetical protein [Saccharothrix deserti]|uniref:hypothetical protein n=1 Tax=Saccharothrix deserti TaxID=2593674 RepID=UPI00131CC044|nr:hypothetical protein [Saccharothrix deserti]